MRSSVNLFIKDVNSLVIFIQRSLPDDIHSTSCGALALVLIIRLRQLKQMQLNFLAHHIVLYLRGRNLSQNHLPLRQHACSPFWRQEAQYQWLLTCVRIEMRKIAKIIATAPFCVHSVVFQNGQLTTTNRSVAMETTSQELTRQQTVSTKRKTLHETELKW